ncbi:MAG: membrane protein insertase YidC [Stenotrophobium sp.]
MENRRFMLIALLGVVLFFIYQAWQKDQVPPPQVSTQQQAATADKVASSASADEPVHVQTPESTSTTDSISSAARIQVKTDKFIAEISLDGGELRRVELVGYPVAKDQPKTNFALLDNTNQHWYVLQSGLATPQETLTGPKTLYASSQKSYTLADGVNSLDVPLEYVDASGYTVRKIYHFVRGSYDIELTQEVRNAGTAALAVSPYVRLWQTPQEKKSSHFGGVHTFDGIAVYEQKAGSADYRFKKFKFDELNKEPVELQQKGGWLAMLQQYFIAAIIPPAGAESTFTGKPGAAQGYVAQYVGAAATVAPQATHTFSSHVYLGPLLQKTIGAVAPGLNLAVDYGILTPIASLIFWWMSFLHSLTHNWGFAIILMTLTVRGAMFKLSEAQYRSMAKMKKFAPRIAELKERYSGDRERMSKATMELYKKEGFNPLAGCWPLVIQFPVFLALYWVLLESVELRQAPFMLWINDLSAADPYFVLPALFGISMFLQQRLSGQQIADPMQQRVMQMMPILMTAFFAFFPSGLVLYWFVSNLTGLTQQWIIKRRLDREDLARASAR